MERFRWRPFPIGRCTRGRIIGLLILIGPVLIVLLTSFTTSQALRFPPPGLTLRWYADLFDPALPTYPVWDLRNCMILEVKFNNSLPAYVQELLTVGAAQHTAASKYVFCRQYEF